MKFNITLQEIVFFFVLHILLYLLTKHRKRIWKWLREFFRQKRGPRQLRPKSPCDCPLCATGASWIPRRLKQHMVPWRERKSKTGYNFVRIHHSLRIRGPSRRWHRTPAMAAGLTHRPWLVRELLLLPMPEEVWIDSYPV